MEAPILYMRSRSPPCRAVLLTAKALNIPLKIVNVNLEDHLKPEFIKLNPQHTVPTLEDGGKIIWDSHAIMTYLVSKYGSDDSLYPKDFYKRAIVDQRLYFEAGIIHNITYQMRNAIVLEGVKEIPENLVVASDKALAFLETFLEGHSWAAGDELTIADFSLITSVTSIGIMTPIDENKFPNIAAWMNRAKALSYYDINQEGLYQLGLLLGIDVDWKKNSTEGDKGDVKNQN